MDRVQKSFIQESVCQELQELLCLEAGQYPEWAQRLYKFGFFSLSKRRMYADWCLIAVLREILPILPRDLRIQIKACFEVRERIWSVGYQEVYYQEQEKAGTQQLQEKKGKMDTRRAD